MPPLTLLAAQKVSDLLTNANALSQQINAIATSSNVTLPVISPDQIVLSSASADMADKDLQFTYPRISIYCAGLKNTQIEKFRSLSGTISVTVELWASSNLLQETDQWIHFYVEAMTDILRQNIGDWGDGIFFSGVYDVSFQAPRVGGLGYSGSAKVTCNLNVSRN
ncbi:MAG: hypothetical protein JOY62_18685 [Acidobacteriaceae bacterium]|nr:hypothetical protein [Acidobacteriaceae bacterium]MBV9781995.1 hypothetical protein [Acidobacteriaceae bacterium]